MPHSREYEPDLVDHMLKEMTKLQNRIALLESKQLTTAPYFASADISPQFGQLAVNDISGSTTGLGISTDRAVYSDSTLVSGSGGQHATDFSIASLTGIPLLDASVHHSSPTFLNTGIYAIIFTCKVDADISDKAFGLTLDVNNSDSLPSGFCTANFPFRKSESTSRTWGCVSLIWYAAVGDSMDTSMSNGDTASHTFTQYVYIQKLTL